MEIFRVAKRGPLDNVSKRLRKISEVIGALIVIGGAITGACSWVSNQFANAVSNQISDFRNEMKASNEKQDQQITWLELMNLIQSDPTNVTGIEKLAKYYFQELNGNQYMTGVYSRWCQQYGGDPSIVVGGK